MASSKDTSLKITPTLLVIFSITLMAVMGTSSIAPAFPQFRRYFQISESKVALLISFYTIPGIILAPLTGWLADKYGRKEVIIPSLLLFGLAGGACFLANSFSTLLILRFLQGMGAASLMALNNAMITDFYSGNKRIAVMGYNTSVLSVGTAVYPAVGGALALLGWNFPFLLPLLALPVAVFVAIYITDRSADQINSPSKEYWKRLRQSANKNLFVVLISVFIAFILFYGAYLTYFPFLMADKFHFGSGTIGVLMAVMSISAALTSFGVGKISERVNLSQTLQYAFLLYAIALFLIILSNSVILIIISVLILGIAQGTCLPCATSLIAFYAPKEHRGIYLSLDTMFVRIGQTVGPLLMGWLFLQFRIADMFYIASAMGFVFFLLLFFWKR